MSQRWADGWCVVDSRVYVDDDGTIFVPVQGRSSLICFAEYDADGALRRWPDVPVVLRGYADDVAAEAAWVLRGAA